MRYIVRNAIFCVTTKPCNSSQAREKQTSVRRYYPDSRSSGFLSALLRAVTHQHKAPVSIDDCTALCRRQPSKREKSPSHLEQNTTQKPSKREKNTPRLEQNDTDNPPNARKVAHVWSNASQQDVKTSKFTYRASHDGLCAADASDQFPSEFQIRSCFAECANARSKSPAPS